MRTGIPAGSAPASALDQLLAIEQEIARRLAESGREADGIVAAARTAAGAFEADAATALARDIDALDARDQAAREALVRAIEEEAERTVRRYRTLDDAGVARLAALAISEATGLDPGEAP